MSLLITAAQRSERWLSLNQQEADQALVAAGLGCCEAIKRGEGGPRSTGAETVGLPTIAELIQGTRTDHVDLVATITTCPTELAWRAAERGPEWVKAFGLVTLSYARSADPECVAGLVRAGFRLGAAGPLLHRCVSYLLDQQRTDGAFGLVSRQHRHADPPTQAVIEKAVLKLTVDTLWALAEVNCDNRRVSSAG